MAAKYSHHAFQHRKVEARISANKYGVRHDCISASEVTDDTERRPIIAPQLHERGLAREVASEEATIADSMAIQVPREISRPERRAFPDEKQETEPTGISRTFR